MIAVASLFGSPAARRPNNRLARRRQATTARSIPIRLARLVLRAMIANVVPNAGTPKPRWMRRRLRRLVV
jgi:hypothetical protein